MTDAIDEYMMSRLFRFNDTVQFVNLARDDRKLAYLEKKADAEEDDEDAEKDEPVTDVTKLCAWLKTLLGPQIENVVQSTKLTKTAAVVTASLSGMTSNVERIVRAQNMRMGKHNDDSAKPNSQVLEINAKHPVIQKLAKRVNADMKDPELERAAKLVYNTALVSSGYSIERSTMFSNDMMKMIDEYVDAHPGKAPAASQGVPYDKKAAKAAEATAENPIKVEL